jgi:hypothetical protein
MSAWEILSYEHIAERDKMTFRDWVRDAVEIFELRQEYQKDSVFLPENFYHECIVPTPRYYKSVLRHLRPYNKIIAQPGEHFLMEVIVIVSKFWKKFIEQYKKMYHFPEKRAKGKHAIKNSHTKHKSKTTKKKDILEGVERK